MSEQARILKLFFDSAVAEKDNALKSNYYSVRFIKDSGTINAGKNSYDTNVLLNGKCLDPESRCLYLFYIDTFYSSAWIIEINIDTRVQTVVYYDPENKIGFNQEFKIYNPRVVSGKLIWTDGNAPIYQMDISRAKKSFYHQIGYAQNENVAEWDDEIYYYAGQIVSRGRYFYSCIIAGKEYDPTYRASYWKKLCLIEEAYYSMKVENFYFAPMPPTLAPSVEYYSDVTRNLNNLRQTLFQFAYNYVYMDWRESTYSPACIVPLPTAEEEIATGLATEMLSRNNCLKISVNSGSEEVRKIRIIGRSNRNPSVWFLVEEIDKIGNDLETLNIAEELELEQTPYLNITITVRVPTGILSGISSPGILGLSSAILDPTVLADYIYADTEPWLPLSWIYNEYGDSVKESNTFTHGHYLVKMYIRDIPSWMTVIDEGTGLPVSSDDEVPSGTELSFYPNTENTGGQRTATIYLEDDTDNENTYEIAVSQSSYVAPIAVTVTEDSEEENIYIDEYTGSSIVGSTAIVFDFTPWHGLYGEGVPYNVGYRIEKNGLEVGSGSIAVQNTYNTGTLTKYMSSPSAIGDVIFVYIWEV